MKKVVARCEEIAGAKINFNKSEGLWLGARRGGVSLPVLVRILEVWFGPGLQLDRNWSEVQAKVDAQVGTWLRRRLSLKGRVDVCAVYIFPLTLYCLSVLPLPQLAFQRAFQRSLYKMLWGGRRPMVRKQVCCQRLCNGDLNMPDRENQ